MVDLTTLTIGDKVSLSKDDDNLLPEGKDKTYASKLLEIKSDNSIVITMPIYKNRIINLEQDGVYILLFFSKNNILKAKGKVVSKYLEKNIRVAEIFLLSNPIRYQRRKFYRLDCIIDTRYRILTPMEEMIQKRISTEMNQSDLITNICKESLNQLQSYNLKATITDLSGGGIRFHSENSHNVGDRFKFNLILSEGKCGLHLEVNVRIIDVTCIHLKPADYEYRALYEDITNETREKIIRYIFAVQREKQRQKKGND
ncbi:flagellar brake protein [Anaerosporobacter sp.]